MAVINQKLLAAHGCRDLILISVIRPAVLKSSQVLSDRPGSSPVAPGRDNPQGNVKRNRVSERERVRARIADIAGDSERDRLTEEDRQQETRSQRSGSRGTGR